MRLNKRFMSLFAVVLVVSLLTGTVTISANSSDGNHYTYTYDCWGYDRESPDAYSVRRTFAGADFAECGNFSNPQGLFVGGPTGKDTYVVDTGNDRIVHFSYNEEKDIFVYEGVITGFTYEKESLMKVDDQGVILAVTSSSVTVEGTPLMEIATSVPKEDTTVLSTKKEESEVAAEAVSGSAATANEFPPTTLNDPQDCYVAENGDIYVADTGNNRIVHMNKNFELVKVILMPEDNTYTEKAFLPQKLVVDNAKRIFAQVQNVNKGFMEFDKEGSFTGYMGASEVSYDFLTYLWKLVATKEQRDQMESFVPTEYSNICLDAEDFIYATISKSEETVEASMPIRKLNAKGTDILVRNGYEDPYGDLRYTEDGEFKGGSKFVDITCLDSDIYYALDNTKGRVFAYDFQGNMLYAFGGHGYKSGYFMNPVALEDLDGKLLVLDSQLGTITQFVLTTYGDKINEGLAMYKNAKYDESAAAWQEVLRLNGNYDQAYIGIGRAQLRNKEYQAAMKNFELKLDDENYSKAYQLYRKEWFEDNIGIILAILAVIIVLGLGTGFVKKAKREVEKECD